MLVRYVEDCWAGGRWKMGFMPATRAESYLRRLEQQGATDLQIVAYEIAEGDLARLTTKDLTSLSDEAVDEFMDQYSHYGRALPHDYQHIIRNTGIGAPEHCFSPDAFGLFGPG